MVSTLDVTAHVPSKNLNSCVPTVETQSLESVSHLRFQFAIPWRGGVRSRLGVEKEGGSEVSHIVSVYFYRLFMRGNEVISTIFTT